MTQQTWYVKGSIEDTHGNQLGPSRPLLERWGYQIVNSLFDGQVLEVTPPIGAQRACTPMAVMPEEEQGVPGMCPEMIEFFDSEGQRLFRFPVDENGKADDPNQYRHGGIWPEDLALAAS